MNEASSGAPRSIVVVDDNPTDCELLAEAIRECDPAQRVIMHESAEALLSYLDEAPPGENYSVFLLDVALPGISGLELLGRLREREDTRRLPVVILSGTDEPVLIKRAYELGANSFLVKADSYVELRELAAELLRYWVGVNRAPAFGR